jgi:ribosomal protein L21E
MIAVHDAVTVTKAGEFRGEVGRVVFVTEEAIPQAFVRFSPKVQRIFNVSDLVLSADGIACGSQVVLNKGDSIFHGLTGTVTEIDGDEYNVEFGPCAYGVYRRDLLTPLAEVR